MFGKLLKYELRSCMKVFLPIWGAMLALSIVNGFTMNINENIGGALEFLTIVLPVMLLVVSYCAAFVLALIYVVNRFYTGLLGDEGYLMFTLPVRSSQIIGAKALTALILEVVSALIAGIGGFCILFISEPKSFAELFSQLFSGLGELPPDTGRWVLMGLEVLALILIAATAVNLRIYTSIAIGHLAQKHRAAWSLLAYVGIGVVLSVLGTVLLAGLGSLSMVGDILMNFKLDTEGAPFAALGGVILVQALMAVAFFFSTNAILNKRLNLE